MKRFLVCVLLLCLLCPAASAREGGLTVEKWKSLKELCEILDQAGPLTSVDVSAQAISKADLTALFARYANVAFTYRVKIGKRKLLKSETNIDLNFDKLEGGMAELLEDLAFFPDVKTVTSKGTVFTPEEMATFVAAYPDVEYHFRLRVANHYTVSTDITAFCTKHALYTKSDNRYDENDFAAFQYCKSLKALDIGHNAAKSLEFLRVLPKLQIFICVDNQITDLTPLESQTELEYLECFLNEGVTDVSPLAKCEKLMDLHISHCSITDISALYGLKKLDRLWLAQNPIPKEQIAHMQELLPNCTINDTVDVHPTAEGWRQGHPRYLKIRKMFGENRYVEFP